jgi:GT2 family glycosyltransferase
MSGLLTINVVSYQRYYETKLCIDSIMRQTDQRFVIDFWNDGADFKKRELISSYNSDKITYRENEFRENKYGHDMKQKSIMSCKTLYWHGTNDDNVFSPYFVERVLQDIQDYDMIKIAVAMANLIDKEDQQDSERLYFIKKNNPNYAEQIVDKILNGVTDYKVLGEIVPVLKSRLNIIGSVDAASIIVKTELLQSVGGWKYLDFAADGMIVEDMCRKNPRIKYLDDVLEVHF